MVDVMWVSQKTCRGELPSALWDPWVVGFMCVLMDLAVNELIKFPIAPLGELNRNMAIVHVDVGDSIIITCRTLATPCSPGSGRASALSSSFEYDSSSPRSSTPVTSQAPSMYFCPSLAGKGMYSESGPSWVAWFVGTRVNHMWISP